MTDHPIPPKAPVSRNTHPHPARPLRSASIAIALSLGAMGLFHGACSCTSTAWELGWKVVCNPGVTYDGTAPDEICLLQAIDGGVDQNSMAAACYEMSYFHAWDPSLEPQDFCDAYIALDAQGHKETCSLDTHEFPVLVIDGGAGDEAGGAESFICEGEPYNAITCSPIAPIVLADGQDPGSSHEVLPFELCDSGGWIDEAAEQAACAANCAATVDLLMQEQNHDWGYEYGSGECEASNFAVSPAYNPTCLAAVEPGSIMAATVMATFTDATNVIVQEGSGAIAYDDSECVTGVPCEPYVMMSFSLASTSFAVADAMLATHAVEATSLALSSVQPARVLTDPASGLRHIEDVELDLTVGAVSVDEAPLGPFQLRDFLGPVDVTVNPRSGQLVLTGTIERDGGTLDLVFVGEPSRPAQWPSG